MERELEVYEDGRWVKESDFLEQGIDFPQFARHSLEEMLVKAREWYNENKKKEVALVFITDKNVDADRDDWCFDTGLYPRHERTVEDENRSFVTESGRAYRKVDISDCVRKLKEDAKACNYDRYYIAAFHNHGSASGVCFVDLHTFLSDNAMVAIVADSGEYMIGLRKEYPDEFALEGDDSVGEFCDRIIENAKKKADDFFVKFMNVLLEQKKGETISPETAEQVNKQIQKSTYTRVDYQWDDIFENVAESTFLQRFRLKKPPVNDHVSKKEN